jgi:hypothetical protein
MAAPPTHWFWKWLQPQRRRKLARRRRAHVETLEARSLLATLLQSYFPDALGPQDLAAVGYRVAATDNYFAVGSQAAAAGFTNAGEAYVFNTTGGFVSRLSNPTPATDDAFGSAIAAAGNLVVVGAYQSDEGLPNVGAAYIFRADTGALLFTLANPTPATGDEFGYAVAIDGNLIAVGSRSDELSAPNSGIVHLFAADTGLLIRSIENPSAGNGDAFGSAVALKGNTLLIGAPADDSGGVDSGRAYLFNATTGTLIDAIDNPSQAANDQFGSVVALSGTMAVLRPATCCSRFKILRLTTANENARTRNGDGCAKLIRSRLMIRQPVTAAWHFFSTLLLARFPPRL